MFRKLFQPQARSAAASVPAETVVYGIGDVHGRRDLLAVLLEAIFAEQRPDAGRMILVFLGDYIDRGADSAGVLQILSELAEVRELESRFLLGNHDETLLDFLRNPAVGSAWCDFGGRDTLMSYGITPPPGRGDPDAWAACADALSAVLPVAHLNFLRRLEDSVVIGDYFFVHAGARPGIPLDQQSHRDLLWIREPFLEGERRFEKVVVHGHTPSEQVHSDDRRIGLDTGAYATGALSAVRLEGEARSFLQAVGMPGERARVVRLGEPTRSQRASSRAAHV